MTDVQLGVKYPKEGCEGVVIDTSLYSQASLLGTTTPLQYALVIRGEAITEKASTEGHSIAVGTSPTFYTISVSKTLT